MTPSKNSASESIAWDVIPAASRRSVGDAPPRGSVRVAFGDDKPEYLSVPASVARILARKRKSGEARPRSREEVEELIRSSSSQAAWERVLALVKRRDYASKDLLGKLRGDGFDVDTAQAIVMRAQKIGLVSDSRFADAFIRAKISAGWGMQRIERELLRKGIDPKSCDGWPYDYLNPDDEFERAVATASRKTVREPHAREKLARFLVGRGFSFGIALDAATYVLEA